MSRDNVMYTKGYRHLRLAAQYLKRVGMGGGCCLQLASCSDVVLVSGINVTYIVLRDSGLNCWSFASEPKSSETTGSPDICVLNSFKS